MISYQTHILPNGLRLVHLPNKSSVSYCGVIVNAGSRDETEEEYGMAHFIEHMLFKGTAKRKSGQIINRLEDVGGELNAYTSKEETVIYAGFLQEYTERAIELISDIVLHSVFPQKEIDKEVEIILDEIRSYKDSPSELIYDDFEEMLYSSNPMSHSVLGNRKNLKRFTTAKTKIFYENHYVLREMVFFSVGMIGFDKIIKWCQRYFQLTHNVYTSPIRKCPSVQQIQRKEVKRNTHQVHSLMGARAYNIYHPDRMVLYLLNNILGGTGMNSLLNLSLREKNGLVYTVESDYQAFTDSGWWAVYFGTDPENADKCEKLVRKELLGLCENRIKEQKLKKYQLQLMGQMAISSENMENLALSLGKSYMRYGKFDDIEEIKKKINSITAEQLQRVANEMFNPDNLSVLRYTK
ncbi:MAG: peptidase domain protein [Bacteroidetes bacterium]|nr:peptidase domain protein [Bacteroidota bacterium]